MLATRRAISKSPGFDRLTSLVLGPAVLGMLGACRAPLPAKDAPQVLQSSIPATPTMAAALPSGPDRNGSPAGGAPLIAPCQDGERQPLATSIDDFEAASPRSFWFSYTDQQ
jgi:hypothetical protein